MKTLHRDVATRLEVWLTADAERTLVRLAQECGRQPASLLVEAFEEWLYHQKLRIERPSETAGTVPRRACQKAVPLATIRF